MAVHHTLSFRTRGRGTTDITAEVARVVRAHPLEAGLANLFLQHTSASLILCENADPTVREDMEMLAARLAPDGDAGYAHDTEGPDDMAAHARSVFTSSSISIPVAKGELLLGTWQGIYLWEHRHAPHTRTLVVTLVAAA